MKKLLLAASAFPASTAIGPQGDRFFPRDGAAAASDRQRRLRLEDDSLCFDGELSCDSSGRANNLALLNPFSDGTEVQFTLTQSTFGKQNILQLSSSNISASSTRAITFVASDTNFLNPTSFIKSSASLTFNANIPDATDCCSSVLGGSRQHPEANPTNTPGTLLKTVSGHATVRTRIRSRDRKTDPVLRQTAPFSMTGRSALET